MRHFLHERLWRRIKIHRSVILRSLGVVCAVVFVVVVIRVHMPRPGAATFNKEYDVSLINYDGQSVRFDTFKHKPVIVFFWATWCPYCQAELTHLGALKTQYGGGVQVLAVDRGESRADAKAFTDALMLPPGIIFLLDQDDGLFKQMKGYAVPETVFVNAHGEEVVHQHGPMTPAEADQAVQKILQ